MTRNTKIALMFAPLLLGAIGLALVVNDARHPQADTDNCMVIATGPQAAELQTPENTLYAQGSNPIHAVAFRCDRREMVVINDMDIAVSNIMAGNGAVLRHKQFKILPERWHFDINTPEGEQNEEAQPD